MAGGQQEGKALAPGYYVPDSTEGITCVADLPEPLVVPRSRNYRRRTCPHGGQACYRDNTGRRVLHDVGSFLNDRPRDLHVASSRPYGASCGRYVSADLSDLALPGSHYTHRVISLAVRLVVEDGLPYRAASGHLLRDHRVVVPYATIPNWLEAAGTKGRAPG
jgi:hypothetical protein